MSFITFFSALNCVQNLDSSKNKLFGCHVRNDQNQEFKVFFITFLRVEKKT